MQIIKFSLDKQTNRFDTKEQEAIEALIHKTYECPFTNNTLTDTHTDQP